jgi:hypothetical protein
MTELGLSAPVRSILDGLRETYGDVQITASDALRLYNGANGGTLEHLSDLELLQLALIQAHDALNDQVHENQGLKLALVQSVDTRNRHARRHR